ncbi:MAG: hypothetical protein P4M14_06520 [Gammaproteobacteria bacterium]|nr:hypothetical protein [Gammaproteobacteria bacterium]
MTDAPRNDLPSSLLAEQYLTSPLTLYVGDVAPPFSKEDIDRLIITFQNLVVAVPCSSLAANTNAFYWLSHMLSCAADKKNNEQVEKITSLLFNLSESDPDNLALGLSKKIETGKYKGQTPAYIIASKVYSSAYYPECKTTVDNLSLLLSSLVKNASEFFATLTESITEENQPGETPLLKLVLTLMRAGERPGNEEAVRCLMDLLIDCFNASRNLKSAITEEITLGIYKNKSIHYFLVLALDQAARTNQQYCVQALTDILAQLSFTLDPFNAFGSLTKTIHSGPYKDLNLLHLTMQIFKSAAYVDNNYDNMHTIAKLLTKIMTDNLARFNTAMTQQFLIPMFAGSAEYRTESGIKLLVNTLTAAFAHQNNITDILNLLTKLTAAPSKAMVDAFLETTNGSVKEDSPLKELTRLLEDKNLSRETHQAIQQIVEKVKTAKQSLYSSPSAQQIAPASSSGMSNALSSPSAFFINPNPSSNLGHRSPPITLDSPYNENIETAHPSKRRSI